MSTEWIALNTKELFVPHSTRIQGVRLEVFLPPHLIPVAVRGNYNKEDKLFVIDFRYIGHSMENFKIVSSEDNIVKFFVGEKSNRVLKISVDVDSLKAQQVELNVSKAFNSLERKQPKASPLKDSLDVTQRAVQMKHTDLFGALVG